MSGIVHSVTKAVGGMLGDVQSMGTEYAQKQQGAANKANADAVAAGRSDVLAAEGQATGALDPYAQAGVGATGKLGSLLGQGFSFGAKDFQEDPGYQFAMKQGLSATQNAGGVQGSPFGGATQAAMQQFATGLAGQQYQQQYSNAFNRWQSQVNNLQQLAGLGANAAGAQAQASTAAGAQIAGLDEALVGGTSQNFGSAISGNTNLMNTWLGWL